MKTYLKNLLEELNSPRSKPDESFSMAIMSVLRMALEGTRFNLGDVHTLVSGTGGYINEKDSPYGYEVHITAIRKPHWSKFDLNNETRMCIHCGTDHFDDDTHCGSRDFKPAVYELDGHDLVPIEDIDWTGYEK